MKGPPCPHQVSFLKYLALSPALPFCLASKLTLLMELAPPFRFTLLRTHSHWAHRFPYLVGLKVFLSKPSLSFGHAHSHSHFF